MSRQGERMILNGTPLSPGLAQGIVHIHRSLLGPINVPVNIEQKNVEEEFSRLDAATAKISDDLIALAGRVEREIDERLATVFGAHQMIVNDVSLREELRREIVENLVSASSAVKTVFLRWENRFLTMESQISREKGDDIRDVSNRLRDALAGVTAHPLDKIPERCVLATLRLLPSDTVFLADRNTSAVLLEYGSRGSHAALFAREMGLPCISGLNNLVTTVADGTLALVNADTGSVILSPDRRDRDQFELEIGRQAQDTRTARERAARPAVTRDGVAIAVLANVGCRDDTETAMANGGEGVGLYRMERAYLGRTAPPSKEELIGEMRGTLEPALGMPVCVRLLDVGADKPLSYMTFLAETNPALGRRGIRYLLEYPELLKTHLDALLELSSAFDLSILIPMVSLPDDITVVRELLLTLAAARNLSVLPRLGAMIETPGAALSARNLAPHVDLLSFGTNDLTQYAFAADRENAAVERYFNDKDDVIFRMLRLVHEDVPDMPLSICGELAGHPGSIAQLLGCGIRTLSVAAPLIPAVKEEIRRTLWTPE
ncbi:MAG: phosphoenolpyruvate--protein phosphotransferase [Planctomycetota bacterium]|jgi:phosphoenolpyruvate-protein phosphotransferase